jgi:hypothetical protein
MEGRRMARATKRQAQSALRAIRKFYGYRPGEYGGPQLVEEYHGWYSTTRNAIVWEEGPFEWAIRASLGGFDEELYHDLKGFMPSEQAAEKAKQQPIKMPKGTYLEPINSYSLGLYTV